MIDIIMWVMTAIAIGGFFLNMKMNKWGYILWIVSNAGFVVNDLHIKQYPQAGLFAFYVVMCTVGFFQWSKRDEDKKPKPEKRLIVLGKTLDKDFRKGDLCLQIKSPNIHSALTLKKLHNNKTKIVKLATLDEDIKKEDLGLVK